MQDFPAISNHYTTSMPELEDAQNQFESELVQWMGERSSFTVLPSIYIRFMFLSDPKPIIGYACHSLTHSLTHWLTHSILVNLIDVTLACEDGNSKLEIVTDAEVSDEDRVGNSLLQIWKLRFGLRALRSRF